MPTRSNLIRKAASLPVGHPTRQRILAKVQRFPKQANLRDLALAVEPYVTDGSFEPKARVKKPAMEFAELLHGDIQMTVVKAVWNGWRNGEVVVDGQSSTDAEVETRHFYYRATLEHPTEAHFTADGMLTLGDIQKALRQGDTGDYFTWQPKDLALLFKDARVLRALTKWLLKIGSELEGWDYLDDLAETAAEAGAEETYVSSLDDQGLEDDVEVNWEVAANENRVSMDGEAEATSNGVSYVGWLKFPLHVEVNQKARGTITDRGRKQLYEDAKEYEMEQRGRDRDYDW